MRFFIGLITAIFLSFSIVGPSSAEQGFAPNVVSLPAGMSVPTEPIEYADGTRGSLEDFRGDVLVVTLWQVHCPYCRLEMPLLNQLSKDMAGQGVRVVALGLDQNMPAIEEYMARHGHDAIQPIMDVDKFNGLMMSYLLFGRLSIGTPTSFIVDKSGNVTDRIWGRVDWQSEDAKNYLKGLAAG